MSNRLFQGIIHQMKDAIHRTIGIIDEHGVVIASTELNKIGLMASDAEIDLLNTQKLIRSNGFTYKPLKSHTRIEYVVFVEGVDEIAENTVVILGISLQNIKELFDEKYDKCEFIKNIVMDNILPSDVYVKSKELHLESETLRVAYLIRFQGKTEALPYDMVYNLFPDQEDTYLFSVSEFDIVLIRELKPDYDPKEIEKSAYSIIDTLAADYYARVNVGIGSVVENIRELARSYKEAQTALGVGKVFDSEKSVVNYEFLGIGRLIYQLPTTLCEIFLNEVFKKGALESLDRETLATIQGFFENNLNVSETSRKLFVHRNTLVYRLEKIKKITGLDLREFENAITFKVALMVKRYLQSKSINNRGNQ